MREKTPGVMNGGYQHPTTIYKSSTVNKPYCHIMRERLSRCPSCGGYLKDHQDGDRLIKLPCNKWTCPYCGAIKRQRLLDDIGHGGHIVQEQGRRWRFLTLTLTTHVDGRKIDLFWQRFRSYMLKRGYRPTYFKVKEFTEKGQRHLHVLIDVFIPFNEIQYAWRLATEGTSYWVHIKKAEVKRAAGYMAKYLTKQSVNSTQFDKGERRYSFSKHFPRLPREKKDTEPGRYEYLSPVDYMYECLDNGTWYEGDPPPKTEEMEFWNN